MKTRWLPKAARDLQEIYDYLLEHYAWQAESTMDEIYSATRSLKEFPHRGRPGSRSKLREFVLPNLPYIIFYKLEEDTVEIVHIRHGARKPHVH